MAVTDEEALQAIQALVDQGKPDEAEALATEFKSLRGGDQPTPTAAPLGSEAGPSAGEDPDDPLGGVPTHIGDVELSPAMRKEFLAGSKLTDPKERGLAEAAFVGRLRSAGGGGGLGEGALNAFTSMFDILGIPSTAGAGIAAAVSPELTFGEALAKQRAFSTAQAEKFPKTTFGSRLVGDVIGGGALIKGGAKIAGKVGGKELLEKASVFTRGTGVKGALKRMLAFSTVGATEGALTEGLRRGEPITGATLGLLAGPGGEALALLPKVASAVTPGALKALVRDPATRGVRVLADKLGESHEEMLRRFTEFQHIFKRPPTVAELANREAALELRDIIADSTRTSLIAREGIESLEAGTAREVSEAVTRGVTPATTAGQTAAQKKVADKLFKKVRAEAFEFEGDDIRLFLEDDDIMGLVPKETRKEIREQIKAATDDEGNIIGSVVLDGEFIDDLRLALGAAAKGGKGFPRKFLAAQEDLMALAGEQSEVLGEAVGQFAKRSRRLEGLQRGRAAIDAPTSEFVEGVKATTDPNILAAQRQGIRAELSDVALKGPREATKVAERLVKDTGLQDRLKAALPEDQFEALNAVGRARQRGAENLRTLDPGIRKAAGKALDNTRDAILAAGPLPAASRALAAARLVKHKGLGIDRRVADNLVRDLFDPDKSEEVINLLLSRGLSEKDVAMIFVASQATGSAARQAAE